MTLSTESKEAAYLATRPMDDGARQVLARAFEQPAYIEAQAMVGEAHHEALRHMTLEFAKRAAIKPDHRLKAIEQQGMITGYFNNAGIGNNQYEIGVRLVDAVNAGAAQIYPASEQNGHDGNTAAKTLTGGNGDGHAAKHVRKR